MQEISYVQKGHKLTQKEREYIEEKLMKHQELLEKATGISVLTRFNENYPPDRKYRMEISLTMPHIFIKVEDRGMTLESLIDQLEVLLKRKVKRYLGQFNKWEKSEPWKISEAKEQVEEHLDETYDYTNYQPAVRKLKLDTNRPMHVGEAIERLEMSGKSAILFKNYSTEKYAMLSKESEGGYELTEADV